MSSNTPRNTKRKQQSRLAFDPVEPSSSTTMSPARIILEAPSKSSPRPPGGSKQTSLRGQQGKQKHSSKLPFDPASSPSMSSRTQLRSGMKGEDGLDGSHSEEDVSSIHKSHRRKLNPVKSESKSAGKSSSGYEESGPSSTTASTFISRSLGYRNKVHDRTRDVSSSDEIAATIPNPPTVGLEKQQEGRLIDMPLLKSTPLAESSDRVSTNSDRVMPSSTDKKTSAKRSISRGNLVGRHTPKKLSQLSNEASAPSLLKSQRFPAFMETDEFDQNIATLPTPKAPPSSHSKLNVEAYDDEEEYEPVRSLSSRRWGLRSSSVNKIGPDRIKASQHVADLSSDDDLVEITNISYSTTKQPLSVTEPIEDSDDDVVLTSPAKRRRMLSVGDAQDSDDVVSSPSKRRRRTVRVHEESSDSDRAAHGKRIDKKETSRDHSPPQRVTRQQQKTKAHRTAKEKQLEILRRKRAGEDPELTPSSTEDDGLRRGVYDTDSDLEVLSDFDDDEEEEENEESIRQSIRGINNNEYDDDFVVDDEDEAIGVPGFSLHDIPLEFTHRAHQKLVDHFKDAVEWMVQRAINPGGFDREDPIYIQAFRKLDDEVRGLASSKFTSSVWKEGFVRALWARPTFHEEPISTLLGKGCEACGRLSHPATFEIRFDGNAYNKESLDDIDNELSDDDDEDVSVSVNSKGQELPPSSTCYSVGRTCKGNAETAHSLIHWKWALNDWVVDTLGKEGHLSSGKARERNKWSDKKKTKYANDLVDNWGKTGDIKSLWKAFKVNLEAAREVKQGRFGLSR